MDLYSLGPAGVSGEQVASVTVQDSASSGAADIQVSLDASGTAAFSTMTQELAGKPAPQSQVAIYALGRVQSAPAVIEPITTGTVTIAGDFTQAQAQRIVDELAVP